MFGKGGAVGGGIIFVIAGLAVATYGIYHLAEIFATDYRATSCELVRESGPHYTGECSNNSSDSSDDHGGFRRRLRQRRLFQLRSCGVYYCVYTMRSWLTENKEFDAEGESDEHRCTEFDHSGDGSNPQKNCYAKFKGGTATGLSLMSEDGDTFFTIFGFAFSFFACCWICCWYGLCHWICEQRSAPCSGTDVRKDERETESTDSVEDISRDETDSGSTCEADSGSTDETLAPASTEGLSKSEADSDSTSTPISVECVAVDV